MTPIMFIKRRIVTQTSVRLFVDDNMKEKPILCIMFFLHFETIIIIIIILFYFNFIQ